MFDSYFNAYKPLHKSFHIVELLLLFYVCLQ